MNGNLRFTDVSFLPLSLRRLCREIEQRRAEENLHVLPHTSKKLKARYLPKKGNVNRGKKIQFILQIINCRCKNSYEYWQLKRTNKKKD